MVIDAVFLYTAFTAREYKGAIIGPFDFAKYLGIFLAVLCVIVIIQSLLSKSKDEKVTIDNFDLVLITIAATALLLILWQLVGIFYLWGYLYVFGLLFAYSRKSEKLSAKNIGALAVLAAIVMAVIYVLFKVLMGFNL